MDAMQLKVPTAPGTWTGQLVAVTARDFNGREYRVATLNLETGPRITGGAYESEGAEGLPLAVLTPGGVGAIAVDDTGVRPGSNVKVSGTMLMTSAVAPPDPFNSGVMKSISLRPDWQPDGELVIQMSGRPKVLKE